MTGLQALYAGFLAVPAVEWVAVGLALAYLLLAIRQNPWCWACAIASAALYSVLFVRSGLVMQAWLQVFYIGMAVYGWRAWRGSATGRPLPVQRWPLRWHVGAIVAVTIIAAINASLLSGAALDGGAPGDAAVVHPLVPYADAFIAWASVFTTLLVARKVLENWLYWIVIDVAAAVLYAVQGLHATTALFVVYSVLAVRGYVAWRRDANLPVAANA